jgi:hypothetical protein
MRAFGVVVLISSIGLLAFSAYSIAESAGMADRLMVASSALGHEIDAADWSRHWVATSAVYGVVAVGGIAAGVGFMLRRSWSVLLWAVLVTFAWISSAVIGSQAKYAFEVYEPLGWFLMAVVVAMSWWWYLRGRVGPSAKVRSAA